MKKVLYLLLISASLHGQQEFGTYFFDHLHQSSELNPAFDAGHKIVIGLPSIYAMGHQRGISIRSAIRGQLTDVGNRRRNQLMIGSNLSLLKVSYKHKNLRYSFAHNYRYFSDFQLGNPLLELIARGNSATIGGSVSIHPELEISSYNETVLGLAYTGNFSIGANVKVLNGLQNIHTKRSNFEFAVNDDIYQLELDADLLINSSIPLNLRDFSVPNFVALDFVPGNFGIAFDIGLSYKNGPFSVSASALDIGYLQWNESVHNYEADGRFVYDGASFSEILEGEFNFLDTIGGSFNFIDNRQSYAHFVPMKMYGNINYAYSDKLNLGVLAYGQRNFDRLNGGVAINLQRHWNNRHALGFQYGVIGSNPLNFGFSGYTTLGPVQVYGLMDNVLGLVNILGAENFNFKFGINLVFDREPQQIQAAYADL